MGIHEDRVAARMADPIYREAYLESYREEILASLSPYLVASFEFQSQRVGGSAIAIDGNAATQNTAVASRELVAA